MNYIIGIDIGTSGTKAVAFSHDGDIVGNAYESYEPVVAPAGRHELSPEVLFRAFENSLSALMAMLEGKGNLTGISFSAAMHSLMLIGKDHQPISNLITWADIRSRDQARALRSSPEGAEIYRLSGTPVHPMTPLTKIIWFRENQPELFQRTVKFISIKEYILFRLTGKYLADYSIASATGLFDIYALKWNPKALLLAGIQEHQLSEAVTTTHIEPVDFVFSNGKLLQTRAVIGASDGCLANLGSNAVHPGDVSLTIGTSGAVRMISSKPNYDPRSRIFNYILTPELYVSGGPINNGGVLLKWYSENFLGREVDDGADFESFVNEAMKIEAGCKGLVFLPYIQGERAPVWDADAKGVFFGITSEHRQAHFMRAIIEGICFSLLDVSQSLEETLGEIRGVYASGGFVKSPAWVQVLADVLGKKINITDTADASSIGAAMLGLYATGAIEKLSDAAKFLTVQRVYEPDTSNSTAYAKNYRIYSGLYSKLKDDFTADL
ncbi:MAG: gluconate kinase [Chitinophagaceae bacterium]|nr:MAG: gluconate kinase [Chitinophagaceae bacterium]